MPENQITDNYQPSLGEVVGNMYRATREAIPKVKDVVSAGVGVVKGTLNFATLPFMLSSSGRRMLEYLGNDEGDIEGFAKNAVSTVYCGFSVLGFVISPMLVHFIKEPLKEFNPEYLLIPLATNIASGVYEWAKHTKKKLIEEHNTTGLEEAVNNTAVSE